MSDEIYSLKLDDLSPETIPMKRLAEYLVQLAKLMGSPEHVQFVDVTDGSAVLNAKVEQEYVAKVASSVTNLESPARKKLESMLAEDSTGAQLLRNGASISTIAASQTKVRKLPKEYYSVRGELLKIGGIDNSIPFAIRETGTGVLYRGNVMSRETASDMGKHLFKPIEVYGLGHWVHNQTKDEWTFKNFEVDSFRPLKNIPILKSLEMIRANSDPNAPDPQELLRQFRSDD